jgi:hypothetical protein
MLCSAVHTKHVPISFCRPLRLQMDVDTMLAKTLLADMGLMGAAQQMAGKGGLTADGLKQVAAASSGKVQPAVPMTKTRSMQ